jgi:riboflavin synthase
MFTGLIQATGTVKSLTTHHLEITYTNFDHISAFNDLEVGDSVAVDGVCLTVTYIMAHGFRADVSPETLRRTTLGTAAEFGTLVNLETSLRMGSKIGGHLVTGHIDGIGYLESAIAEDTAWQISLLIPHSPTSHYIVPKGSLAVNGISLTVADCNPEGTWLSVAVIPHTYTATNLHTLEPGQAVNLESDILGKYVAKFIAPHSTSHQSINAIPNGTDAQMGISVNFLNENGYI